MEDKYLCITSMYDTETGECMFHQDTTYHGFFDDDGYFHAIAEDGSDIAFDDDWDAIFEKYGG